MALITHLNFATTLKESTNPRGSSPNGNVYFDVANNLIQLIGADELATFDHTSIGGGAGQANQLVTADGITMRALYNFENARRRVNETLRRYKRGTDGDYRFAGAFSFVNGVKLRDADRAKVRGSGFIEYANTLDGATNVDRIYHGVLSLVDIQNTSVPYWALVTATDEATMQAATWTNFVQPGDINEVVQVFGSTAFGDASAGAFDFRTRTLVVRVRTWGYNPGETTSVLTGITEFSGFSAGYGVGESINTNNPYTLANVFGGARIAPWTGMSLERLASPQVETGFNEGNGSFTWTLNNTGGGTAQQCAAFLDAVTLQDADVDTGAGSYNGKRGRLWYTRNAAGKIVTTSLGGEGLFIEGLSTAERQNVVLTDNAGTARTYPFFPEVQITVGTAALADPNAWYHVFYVDGAGVADYDAAGAVTVQNSASAEVKGNVQANQVAGRISFAYAYDTNVQAGLTAGTDKTCVVIVEGDGIAAQALTQFTITRSPVISVTCAPTTDNNA